jgi:hypothetical protein
MLHRLAVLFWLQIRHRRMEELILPGSMVGLGMIVSLLLIMFDGVHADLLLTV